MTNRQACAALAAMILPLALGTGCATNCVRGPEGTTCTAKSLKRFDGTPPPPQVVDHVPGSPIVIAVQYGSVLVSRSPSSKVEVEFRPFCYAGYDDQAGAYQQLGQNLETRVDTSAGVAVHVARHGGTNGLGANVNVRLPDSFNGSLAITNAGDGPLNEFEVRVEYVAQATALDIRNRSSLGNCWAAGTPAIQSTGVSCGGYISVFDVSDKLEIINTGGYHRGDDTPAITLRLAKVSPTSPGGTITTASGSRSLRPPPTERSRWGRCRPSARFRLHLPHRRPWPVARAPSTTPPPATAPRVVAQARRATSCWTSSEAIGARVQMGRGANPQPGLMRLPIGKRS